MKKIFSALIFASLASPAGFALAQSSHHGYVSSAEGVVKSGHGLCWRTGYWTEADRTAECDGVAEPARAPLQPVVVAVAELPPPPVRRREVAILEGGALFAFDSDKLTSAGIHSLKGLLRDASSAGAISDIVVVGHADRIGTEAYNHGLALRRAEAVADLLVDLGIPPSSIATRERGESDPVVQCSGQKGRSLIACLAPNRRADVEVEIFLGQ